MKYIIEGPDGSGKTTLIRDLLKDTDLTLAPRQSTSTGGPVANVYDRMVEQLENPQGDIYDRFPMFSEPIYAMSLNRPMDTRFNAENLNALADKYLTKTTVIVCLPPYANAFINLGKEPQMDGVHQNYHEIYWKYFQMTSSPRIYLYDYTIPNAYEALLGAIKANV